MGKFIEGNEERRLSLELYRKGELFGVYISDNEGGSGITVEKPSPEEAANEAAKYIADYFQKNNDEDDDEEFEVDIENYKTYPLYRYDTSVMDGNTIYFYFESKENNCLIFIEYWADEESVGDCWLPYSYDGTPIRGEEDCGEYLTKEQKEYFTQKCKEILEKEEK